MRKNKLYILSFILMIASFITIATVKPAKVVSADEIVYTQITSIEELALIGNDVSYPLSGNYQLTQDLDFETAPDFFDEFVPIGLILNSETGLVESVSSFTGVFDGNGFKISNIHLEDKTYSYFNVGFFASLNSATVKNVGLENFYVNRTNVYPEVETSNSNIFVGGLAAVSQNSTIQTSYVNFDEENLSQVTGTASVYFGGLVAKAYAGTNINNSYVSTNFEAQISGEQASEIKQGAIVGSLENSVISNSHISGSVKAYVTTSSELAAITEIQTGAAAGYVTGQTSIINGIYADVLLYGETTNQNITPQTGALVGQISTSIASTPNAGNLNFAQLNTRTYTLDGENYIIQSITNAFGQKNNYDDSSVTLNLLTQNNYELFNNSTMWSPYQNYIWNFDTVWTFDSASLPTLQIFKYYQIQLNEEETRVNLGESTAQSQTVMLDYVNQGVDTYKNGELVEIVIAIINGYDIYYDLESIEFDMVSTIYNGQFYENYTLEKLDETYEDYDLSAANSAKSYLLSYQISDLTQGDVSVSLSKVSFQLNVKTENENMGLVRKRDSSVSLESFTQDVQNANAYDFFAVPKNTDFAFSYWVIENPAPEGQQPERTELGSYAEYAQISFVFGIGGQEDITNKILAESTLVAVFTSNVTKVTLSNQLTNGEATVDAGYISYTVEGNELDTEVIHSYEKNDAVTLVANTNEGFEFVGWYDGDNRLLSDQTTFNFIPTEDNQTISARYEEIGIATNLTWLWITLGVVGTIGLGIGIFFIIKAKAGDMSYRKFY